MKGGAEWKERGASEVIIVNQLSNIFMTSSRLGRDTRTLWLGQDGNRDNIFAWSEAREAL